MRIRAVVFDFDGTLADSYRAITASVNYVREHHGLPPIPVEEVRPNVGRGLPHLLQMCVPGADLELDARRYRQHHPTVLETGTVLLPGALPTVRTLHELGLKLAICSNKPVAFTRTLVRTLGLAGLIDEVVGPEDVPEPKPAPHMLIEALKRLNVAAPDAVYVGDMTVDIQTARGAGVSVWVVPTGSDNREELQAAHPDQLLTSLEQVPGLIAKL